MAPVELERACAGLAQTRALRGPVGGLVGGRHLCPVFRLGIAGPKNGLDVVGYPMPCDVRMRLARLCDLAIFDRHHCVAGSLGADPIGFLAQLYRRGLVVCNEV